MTAERCPHHCYAASDTTAGWTGNRVRRKSLKLSAQKAHFRDSQNESLVALYFHRPTEAEPEAETMTRRRTPAIGAWIFFTFAIAAGAYFTFAAVQGSFGVFRRAEITAETQDLQIELAELAVEVTRMENLTKRLSDDYLDLDLLDEQARSILGMLRADELVIR